jgi:hypothetical protein
MEFFTTILIVTIFFYPVNFVRYRSVLRDKSLQLEDVPGGSTGFYVYLGIEPLRAALSLALAMNLHVYLMHTTKLSQWITGPIALIVVVPFMVLLMPIVFAAFPTMQRVSDTLDAK